MPSPHTGWLLGTMVALASASRTSNISSAIGSHPRLRTSTKLRLRRRAKGRGSFPPRFRGRSSRLLGRGPHARLTRLRENAEQRAPSSGHSRGHHRIVRGRTAVCRAAPAQTCAGRRHLPWHAQGRRLRLGGPQVAGEVRGPPTLLHLRAPAAARVRTVRRATAPSARSGQRRRCGAVGVQRLSRTAGLKPLTMSQLANVHSNNPPGMEPTSAAPPVPDSSSRLPTAKLA